MAEKLDSIPFPQREANNRPVARERITPQSLEAEQSTLDLRPVPSCPVFAVTSDGEVFKIAGAKTERRGCVRVLPQIHRNGYLQFELREGKNRRRFYVHRVIAETFLGPRPFPQACVRHMDGNPLNNAAANLAWGNAKDNARDRMHHGRTQSGEISRCAKLTKSQVEEIRLRAARGATHSDLAVTFGVCKGNIGFIVRGETWR